MSKNSIRLMALLSILSFSPSIAQSNLNRFIDNADSTVTDKTTGLIWMRCPIGLSGSNCQNGKIESMSWLTALDVGLNTTHAFPTHPLARFGHLFDVETLAALRRWSTLPMV